MTDTLTLTLEGDNYQYQIDNIITDDPTQTKNAVSIAPPGRAASENILLGVQGMEADIGIRFQAHDDGTDRALGTAPVGEFDGDTVVTVGEQKRWLREFVHRSDFSATWTLDHDDGDSYNNAEVFVERINTPTIEQESPKWHTWRIDLRRGGSL